MGTSMIVLFVFIVIIFFIASLTFVAYKRQQIRKMIEAKDARLKVVEEEAKRKADEEAQQQAEEAKRRADEEAQQQAEEAKRKADEEAQRQAEEAKRKADEEAQRQAEEAKRRADEEAQQQAEEAKRKADEEAQQQAEEAKRRADEEAQRQAEEAKSKAEVGADVAETPKLSLLEIEPISNPPTYHPPTPSATHPKKPNGERIPHSTQQVVGDLRLRVQLVFGRGGAVRTLALVPDKHEEMPDEIAVIGRQGELRLVELRDDCYEPVPLVDATNALREGIHLLGRSAEHHWRWVLSGRELYVLAPGDEFGLYGYVSTVRLRLNVSHEILATARLCDQVLVALANAGCAKPEVNNDKTAGVPSGWLLFRDVIPTRAVAMQEDGDILNVLCPAHEVEPYFTGGIRLERNTWLVDFPPRVRFTGELGDSFRVLIDGKPAHTANDGAFEAPGWDAEGEHRLWFADRAETYVLRTMNEGWESWNAYDFGTTGVVICGAGIYRMEGTEWYQLRVPVTNPLLVGSRPGEIFRCRPRQDVRSGTILVLVPFVPVWALPIDPIHADKHLSRAALCIPVIAALMGTTKRSVEGVRILDLLGHQKLKYSRQNSFLRSGWRKVTPRIPREWTG
jgi:F0F1-type ATP synthase membrane subunit b/b'